MKRIKNDLLASATATYEDSSYPVDNMFDGIPDREFRAGHTSTVITFTINAGATAFGMYWLTGTAATVVVKNNAGTTVQTTVFDLTYARHLFVEFTAQALDHTIEVTLTDTTEAKCGIAVAGQVEDIAYPLIVNVSFIDDSIKQRWAAGGKYHLKRRVRRVFDLSFNLIRSTDAKYLEWYVTEYGAEDYAFSFFDSQDKTYFTAYGFIDPVVLKVNHGDNPTRATVNVAVEEV